MTRAYCVCVPARNEAPQIAILIRALAAQTIDGPIAVALCVNNSDDGTAPAALAAARETTGRIDLDLVECMFPAPLAHAGSARRAAMDLGARRLDDSRGILISTDADCRPPPGWIAAILASAGDDVIVGGKIELDEAEAMPPAIAAVRRRFDRYWQQVRAIEDAIDPVPWDPAPRHGDHTGASLALSKGLYRKAGGVPLLETGEDRALVEAAVAAGGRLVHPPSVWTRASARTTGRAANGMALDMRRWAQSGEARPIAVPDFRHWRTRAAWRRTLRSQGQDSRVAQEERALAPMPCDMALPDL